MRTLVLHIGYPKTATSSIQWCLHANRDLFRDRGVYYPLTGQFLDHSHNRLAFTLFENLHERFTGAGRDALFAELADEIDGCGCETVVLSSELLVRNLDSIRQSDCVMDLLGRHRLRGICFVRRQDTFLESLYTQSVWAPKRRVSFDVDTFLDSDIVDQADYHATLSAWAQLLGRQNLTVVVYEQARSGEGCARTFFARLGMSVEGLKDLDIRTNVAVSGPFGTEVMRLLNSYSGLSEDARRELWGQVKELDAYASTLPIPTRLFSPAQCDRIGRRFLASNQRLAAEFVGQALEGQWFREL